MIDTLLLTGNPFALIEKGGRAGHGVANNTNYVAGIEHLVLTRLHFLVQREVVLTVALHTTLSRNYVALPHLVLTRPHFLVNPLIKSTSQSKTLCYVRNGRVFV